MTLSLPDARSLSDEVLEAFRLRAVHGCELGCSETLIADILGLSRETVSRWISAYRDGGPEGLPHNRTGRPIGSGCTLNEEQAAHLRHLLDTQSPEALGIAASLWSRRAVHDLIRKECGIEMPVRTVGAYLQRWGYSAKRPSRHARQQDPDEVREWVEEIYPRIEKMAADENATIFWVDEVGLNADSHPALGYARIGQPATVEVPDCHIRMNEVSAIANNGTARFMTYAGAMTSALFIEFLERLLRSTSGTIYVIMDQLRVHDSAAVSAWAESHEDRMSLLTLPRYSPEVNVDEYMNHDLKQHVHSGRLPNSKPELRTRIQAFMQRLVHVPQCVRSYFQHPRVAYAAQTSM